MADERTQAPFNMALSTLESIRKWIDDIAKISIGIIDGKKIDINDQIVVKHKMVKQLIMLSTPLLDLKDKDEIMEFFSQIKLQKGRIKKDGTLLNNVPIYTEEVDYKLDECVEGIEFALQETGHFMPGPDESSLF